MEKRIELEKRARKANQITELNLDNCRSTSIVGLTDEYTALESLSLINVGLTTLKGFPKLPNLKKLELSDNRISNGLNYLTTSPKLQYLNLSGNKIKELETLKPLQEFKNLAVLDLFNNEATQIENYREKIFEMLPSLKFLDGFDCNDVEAPSDGDDDDEVNGNDSKEDDKQNAFCLSGLEFDLDELEAFEKRVKAKKLMQQQQQQQQELKVQQIDDSTKQTESVDAVDELDEYLKELKLKEEAETSAKSLETNENNVTQAVIPVSASTTSTSTVATTSRRQQQTVYIIRFSMLLYWFLAMLNLANAAYYSTGDEDEEEDYDREGIDGDVSLSDEGDFDDVSLSDEEGTNDDDEDEECDDSDDSDEEANKSANATNAAEKNIENATPEEPQARGKKRKHDG